MKSLRRVWAAAQGNPRNPKIAKRFKRNVNQGAKRPLIPLTLLKNRREAEMGFGDDIPKRVWDWSHAPAVRDSA